MSTTNGRELIASLPWYDSAINTLSLDRFWKAVADELRRSGVSGVPLSLTRTQSINSLWQSPDLMLSQCCGPDLLTAKGNQLSVIATPVFGELDCEPGYYYSTIVGRLKLQGSAVRIAVNSLTSRSGFTALTDWLQTHDIEISATTISGSHVESLRLLEQGAADIAAIDAHTVNQLGLSLSLPILGRSAPALAPPYVHHPQLPFEADLLFGALHSAIESHGSDIGIIDIIRSDRAHYKRAFSTS